MTVETPLGALAGSITDLIGIVVETGHREDWIFQPGSPGQGDWSLNEMSGEWGAQPLEDAYKTGTMFWMGIADHVRSLADDLRQERPFAMHSTARALTESCVRGWYLLQQGIDPIERVRRLMNDRLHALFEDSIYTADFGIDGKWRDATRVRILAEATNRGVDHSDEERHRYRAACLLPGRKRTQSLLAECIGNRKLADAFYRNSSGVAHAALHSISRNIRLEDALLEGRARPIAASAPQAATEISAAVVALWAYIRALLTQTGWNPKPYERTEAIAVTLWQSQIDTAVGQ